MAIYKWSELTNGLEITFDPTQDKIFIDNPSLTANSLTNYGWSNSNQDFFLAIGTIQVTFVGLGRNELAADTLTFANGGLFLVGDLSVATLDDDANNTINGGNSDDILMGLGGDDILNGGTGNDRIFGHAGNDIINGGDGNNDIAGYSASITDPLYANLQTGHGYQQGGVDTYVSIEGLRGSAGDDYLVGNSIWNSLGGGAGNDWLVGGRGGDYLIGSTGNDVFVFQDQMDSTPSATDTIQDFQNGDHLQFEWMSGIDLPPHTYSWQGTVNDTLASIRNESTLTDVAVFFTNDTDGWLTIKGNGSGDGYDNTLIKLTGRTTALTTDDFLGCDGTTTINSKKVNPTDPANNDDLFGVAVSGDDDQWAVIGAPGEDTLGTDAGTVYLYQWQGHERLLRGTLSENISTLTLNDTAIGDGFGGALDMAGNVLIVGAANDDIRPDGTTGNDNGGAFVFRYNQMQDAWIQEAHLVSADMGDFAHLGSTVAINGDWAAVGSAATNPADQGVVLYHYASGIWSQHSFLSSSALGYTDGGEFGTAIALENGVLVIGAPGDDTKGQDAGAAYVYVYKSATDTWDQEGGVVTDPAGNDGDGFGAAVDVKLNDNNVYTVVGAPGDDTGSVSVYHFDGTQTRQGTLTPSTGQSGDQFGISVAIDDGGDVTVGAASGATFAYFFNYDAPGAWWENLRIPASGGEVGNQATASPVAIGVGAHSLILGVCSDQTTGTEAGAAYLYGDVQGTEGTVGDDFLLGGDEPDTLNGGDGNDNLYGNDNNDTLDGGPGADMLDGGRGVDALIGGSGNDTYYVDDAGDIITETNALDTEIDTVISSVNWALAENLENLTLTVSAALNGTGNGLDNVLIGNSAANLLNGEGGDDTLTGNGGNDTLIGGSGLDIAKYFGVQSEYSIINNGDGSWTVSDAVEGRDGTDTLTEIESLLFSDQTFVLDTTAPTVSSFNPADGAIAVATTANVIVTFNEDIQRGAGSIVLKTAAGTMVETFDVATSSQLAIAGATLTIDPTSILAHGTDYFVAFALGTLKDLVGNAYVGTATYDFTTVADITAPTVLSFSPTDAATDVSTSANIVVTLDESIQRGTGNIVLKTATGVTVETFEAASSDRLSIADATITINPTGPLANNTHYFVTFETGTIKDLAGNACVGTTSYDFTTTPPPGQNITGTSGDDALTGGLGDDTFNGGDGVDTLILSGLPSQYHLNGNILNGDEGTDSLSSIEQFHFGTPYVVDLDPIALIDPDGEGPNIPPATELLQNISDLYIAYFNRAPDVDGLMYWFSEIYNDKLTLYSTAQSFTDSPEYKATYPEGLSNRDFIERIYQNLFDREPDTEGWNYWDNDLNHGTPRNVFIYTVIKGAFAPTGSASDKALLNNKHDVSLYYSEQLATSTEGFDTNITQVLNRVNADDQTVKNAVNVIDYVIDNPITLTGLINDTPAAWEAFWV